MTVSDLVLRPNQKTWQFPLRDARRKYTTTISDPAVTTDGWIGNDHPGESLQDLTIRFLEAEEDGEVGESSRHDAQQDRNSGQASHPADDGLFDGFEPDASRPRPEDTQPQPVPLPPGATIPEDAPTPGAKSASQDKLDNPNGTITNSAPPLTEVEALQVMHLRDEWRSIVAPGLSGGRTGEWKSFSGVQRRTMILQHQGSPGKNIAVYLRKARLPHL